LGENCFDGLKRMEEENGREYKRMEK